MNTEIMEWKRNLGTVPEGVIERTSVQVQYRSGDFGVWGTDIAPSNDPDLWALMDDHYNVMRWRFVHPS